MLSREELEIQEMVKHVLVDEAIVDYMLAIVERTRTHEGLALGVSPRGSQAFYRAVQAYAVVEDRGFAVPDDAKMLAPKVFGHRVVPGPVRPLRHAATGTPRRRVSELSKKF